MVREKNKYVYPFRDMTKYATLAPYQVVLFRLIGKGNCQKHLNPHISTTTRDIAKKL